MNPSGIISNILGHNTRSGAPVSRQHQWRLFSEAQKQTLRKRLKDSDHDGVPDYYDCQPRNRKYQDDDTGPTTETWRVVFENGIFEDVRVQRGEDKESIVAKARGMATYKNKDTNARVERVLKIYNG
jgi:hypothetical protein